jgi:hypothetical protein
MQDVGNSTMPGDTTKVIVTVALGLALYISFVPPPQPAAAADALTEGDKRYLENTFKDLLTTAIGDKIKQNNQDLADRIADKIKQNNQDLADKIAAATNTQHPVPVSCVDRSDCRVPVSCVDRSDCRPPPHHVPIKVVVVEKVVHVAPRPHWCCRPPPPRPCPPEWGWY